MRFHLTSEQVAIQDAVRGTLTDCWGLEHLHRMADSDLDFDATSWRALMELGIGGLALPETVGGADLGLLEAALVCEVAGETAAPGPLIGQIVTAIAIAASTNLETLALLPEIAAGTKVATLAIETDLVPCARAAHLFLADDGAGGLRLIEAGLGVKIEAQASTDRSRPVSRVDFSTKAKSHALFAAGDPMVQRIHDAALILLAADSLGGAQHCTNVSVDYAKTREQFGQPIGKFQGLKHQLAHMALDVEPARALVWYAAYAWDAQLKDASRSAAMAKAHLCEVFTRLSRAAIAAHGGIGYTWEYGLSYWFRRSVHNSSWMGSPSHHRVRAAELADW